MHILFLSHRVPFPPNKGEKIRTFHQIKYLKEQGHSISLFSPVSSEEEKRNAQALRQHYCESTHVAAKPSAMSYITGLLKNKPLSVSNFYSRSLQRKLDNFLETERVDTIVCTSSSMAEYVFKAKFAKTINAHTTLVMDFMDLDSDKWTQYKTLKPFPFSLIYWRESKLLSSYERLIHQIFDASLFISANEIELFLKSTQDLGKIHMVANGLDTASFKPSIKQKPADGPYLLFTGVMDYLPNVDAVCWFVENAWIKIREEYPEAVFYIAGMNPNAKVKALEARPGIVVTGFVDDIHSYFDKAHLFVAPFRIARGVQNKVLQALASGLPTVGTPIAAEGINCLDGEHILIADSIDEFTTKIFWLLKHPEEAKKIANNGVELIQQNYSWESKLANFEKILGAQTKPNFSSE